MPTPHTHHRVVSLLVGALALGACSDESGQSPTAAAPPPPSLSAAVRSATKNPIPDQYVVVFRRDVADPRGAARGLAQAHGGTVLHTYEHAIKGFAIRASAQAAEALARNPNVEYVEQDAMFEPVATQTGATWGIDRVDQRDLPVSTTYSYTADGSGITVYIIDTGIRLSHDEFGGRATSGFDFIDGGSADDCNGHGTHVAGTVGGTTYGVAKNANLVAVRVFGCSGGSPSSTIIAAVDWVTANHVPRSIVNMSLGGGFHAATNTAVTNSINAGITYVLAAGNDFASDACNVSPASTPAALTVGSTNMDDARRASSNVGTCLDLFAPGGLITSAWFSSDAATNTISGTSMAAPHVAGAAALYLQANPGSTPAQIAAAIVANATPGKVTDARAGSPNLLLYTGFITAPNQAPVSNAGGPYAANEGAAIALTWSASDADGDALTYSWDFGNGVTGSGPTLPASYTYPDDPAGATPSFTISITADDGKGGTDTETTTATIANVAPTGTFAAAPSPVVVGHPVTLSFSSVADVSSVDLAAGITRTYSCTGLAGPFGASAACTTSGVGSLSVAGRLTDKDGGATTYGPQSVTVGAATTTVTPSNAAGQYSDQVTLSASLSSNAGPNVANAPTGTMEFFVGGVSVGSTPVLATGVVTRAFTIDRPQGSYPVTAQFTSTNANYASGAATTPASLTVSSEAATLALDAANAAAVKVATAGGASPAFSLRVTVAETTPDLAGGTPLAGDINRAPVRMTLLPVGPGSPVNSASCTGPAAGAGYASITYTCSFAAGVPVNTYTIQAAVISAPAGGTYPAGTYYAGTTEDALTVYDPSLGFATGGGSFRWPGTDERTTFGFTMKYNKNGNSPQGSLLVVRHLADGTIYRFKSNALEGLALSPVASPFGYATFSGKGTYLEPGWSEPRGNFAFTTYVEDNNEPGTGSDRFWLQVTGGMGIGGTATGNARTLSGGNVAVPHGGR